MFFDVTVLLFSCETNHFAQILCGCLFVKYFRTDKEQVARMNGALRTILEDDSYQRFPRERDIYTRMLANFLATEQNQKVEKIFHAHKYNLLLLDEPCS